jgi:adenosylhomocysteine nucleosidase
MTRLAIISAMDEELSALLPLLADARSELHAGRRFHLGRLGAHEAVLVLCGIGKVAAACTATLLAERYSAGRMVFTGVAGGLHAQVRVGDVVIASELLQHDLDASPLFPRHEVPLLGLARFAADAELSAQWQAAAQSALNTSAQWLDADAAALGVTKPRLHRGLVISGDRFVATAAESQALRTELPDALAVEMEGAAVAQVCHAFGLPLAVLRIISDRADDSAHVDFQRFLGSVVRRMTATIVQRWLAGAAA